MSDVNPVSVLVFLVFVAVVLGISFYFGRKATSARGYYAAHGQINWFVNGVAFAGDYLSAASFLGICGMIAFYGFDGFLYSIGYLAGWVVALFVIAEPLKRLGRFTFADALDKRFNSRGIKLSAAISTLVVSLFYLVPQMVGAGALIQPLLGFPHWAGVLLVGVLVTVIVVTAGMVSTTYVQFIKGSLLVFFCALLTILILRRGLVVNALRSNPAVSTLPAAAVKTSPVGAAAKPAGPPVVYYTLNNSDGSVAVWKESEGKYQQLRSVTEPSPSDGGKADPRPTGPAASYAGYGPAEDAAKTLPSGRIAALPGGAGSTGPLGPIGYLSTLQDSQVQFWSAETFKTANGTTKAFIPKVVPAAKLLVPGGSPTFKGVRSAKLRDKLDFLSLMLALFGGTASLPHILIRYYTVKDQAAARKSTVVGIAAIGFFYVLTLYLGLGAMTGGAVDVTSVANSNKAAPLLAQSYGSILFSIISAIAFTTVLGTVSGLIMAASGAVAHDIMTNFLKIDMTDHQKVTAGKVVAIIVGVAAMVLGIIFKSFNVTFLVGWAFNVAASANLPALIMLLFWSRTTKAGITASIVVGLASSLGWLLLSAPAFQFLYNYPAAVAATKAIVPFSQPGLVTIPLSFLVLVVVSLMTARPARPASVSMTSSAAV